MLTDLTVVLPTPATMPKTVQYNYDRTHKYGPPLWNMASRFLADGTTKNASVKKLFGVFGYPEEPDASLVDMRKKLLVDIRRRLGPGGKRRDYRCDLQCGSLAAEQEPRSKTRCQTAIRAGRVHVAYIVDNLYWLSGVFASIVSLLESNGGYCKTLGAFHFHVVMPAGPLVRATGEAAEILRGLNMSDDTTPSLLQGAVTLHTLDPAATRLHAMMQWDQREQRKLLGDRIGRNKEKQRLNRASNFARFVLADVLPRAVEHVLYIDCDILAVRGAWDAGGVGGHSAVLAGLKRHYHRTVRLLKMHAKAAQASGDRGGRLRSALAAVPGYCSAEDFASEFVSRQFVPNSTKEQQAEAWVRGWAVERARRNMSGSLCFNAGVFLASMTEWRRLGLMERLQQLVLTRRPPGSSLGFPLWQTGTQRPLRILFGGDIVPLAYNFNVEGCGAARSHAQCTGPSAHGALSGGTAHAAPAPCAWHRRVADHDQDGPLHRPRRGAGPQAPPRRVCARRRALPLHG